jgi:hypothetical protein
MSVFGLTKRERAEKELQEIRTWIIGQSMVIATTLSGGPAFQGTHSQFAIALEASCFFLHALSRIAWRPQSEKLRESVLDPSVDRLATAFADMVRKIQDAPGPDLVSLFNARELEYGAAKSLIGETYQDRDTAVRIAATHIASAAGIPARDISVLALATELVGSLNRMELAGRVKKVEAALS